MTRFTAFLSFPISNDPNWEAKLAKYKSIMIDSGFENVNPLFILDEKLNNFVDSKYITMFPLYDKYIKESDVFILAPGWRKSHGCCIELGMAIAHNKTIYTMIKDSDDSYRISLGIIE